MNKITIMILISSILLGVDSHHINPNAPSGKTNKLDASDKKSKDSNKDKEKSFQNSIKDMKKISGLFTMYFDENKNTAYIEVKPDTNRD